MKSYFEKIDGRYFLYYFDTNIRLWTVYETDEEKSQISSEADHYPTRDEMLRFHKLTFLPEEQYDKIRDQAERIASLIEKYKKPSPEPEKLSIFDDVNSFLARNFYGNTTYMEIMESCDLAQGNCVDVSEELKDYLISIGYDKNDLELVDLKGPKFDLSEAHSESKYTFENHPEDLFHEVLKVKDLYVDLTMVQFGPAFSGVRIYSKEQLAEYWNQIGTLKTEAPEAKSKFLDYDYYIVAFSGGKDSTACFLHLLDMGIPKNKIELWHHKIDGNEGSTLMDWPATEDYCRKFAEAFNVPIFFSWKEGGFEREMLRYNKPTAQNHFEYPEDNIIECGLSGGRGTLGTRRKFPQVSADLNVRWCSAYLKIDVCTAAVNNQVRFHHKKTIVITGERAEESAARSRYKTFEPDKADRRDGKKKRHVDHWRPVHAWKEQQVWDIIKKYKVLPHPAYRMGFARLSCMKCIFGSNNQWATIHSIDLKGLQKLVDYEKEFGVTIHRTLSIPERVEKGEEYNPAWRVNGVLPAAMSHKYELPIFTSNWMMPAGAFGENAGPQ